MSAITRVARLTARLAPFRWEWAEANAARIAAHWEARRARQPDLFDGRVLMVATLSVAAGEGAATFFETNYARLLAHIDLGFPDPAVANGFAMGALRVGDGAYLLGEMAPHTANAGRLYFPAGTPDLSDLRPGGEVDLAGSIRREIAEETGFGSDELDAASGWTIVRHGGRLAFMQEVRLGLDAEEAVRRARAHIAAQPKSELSDVRILRAPDEIDEDRMPSFLPVFLRDAFGSAG